MSHYLPDVELLLDRLYINAEGASLRRADRRKAVEIAAMLEEISRAIARISCRRGLLLVDAAAGKSYVGLLAAKLLLEPAGRPATVITIECDPQRVSLSRRAAESLQTSIPLECRAGRVEDAAVWPAEPSLIAALHACGDAADAIIDRAVASRARMLLLVPCCTSQKVHGAAQALARADSLGIPRHAPVRRRFIQSMVDAERTLRLEAAGYETEVVEFVAPTVTPHNVLWRARYVGEARRMATALSAWEKLAP